MSQLGCVISGNKLQRQKKGSWSLERKAKVMYLGRREEGKVFLRGRTPYLVFIPGHCLWESDMGTGDWPGRLSPLDADSHQRHPRCCGCDEQIHTDCRSPVEKRDGLATL